MPRIEPRPSPHRASLRPIRPDAARFGSLTRRQAILFALAVAASLVPGQGIVRIASAAGEFVPGIEDLPLMDGLTAIEGSGFAFDTTGGRLVEAYAGGDLTEETVEAFYAGTLPALGWEPAGPRLWRREGETLSIEFVDGADPVTVRFQLSPQ